MNEYEQIYNNNSSEILTAPQVTVKEKEKPVYTKTERITAAVMLVLGFLWVRLCLYHASGIFTSLLDCGIITALAVFLRKGGRAFTRSEKLAFAVLYVFSFVYTITANTLLKGLDTVFLMLVGSLLLFHTANPDGDILRFLPVSLAKGFVAAPFRNFTAAPLALTSGAKSGSFWKNAGYVIMGLVLAVPVTVIAAALLCSADANMASLMERVLQMPSEELLTLIPHAIAGFVIGMMLFSAMYTASRRGLTIDPAACAETAKNCRIVPGIMVYAMVTPLCLLYLLFFFSQMQYFLGGFTGETTGFTYAEYARRGFFELCGVCCMNLLVIGGMGLFAKRGDKRPAALRGFGCFLCVSSLLLAGTAIAKMLLYIRVYGMTQLRVYTTWFMLLLVIFFVLLCVKQFREDLNLGKIMSVVFTVLFAFLCFSRPDAWMTRYNAEMYLSGQLEEFDSEVLYEMSDDAWAALTAYEDTTVRCLLGADEMAHFKRRTQRDFRDFYKDTNLSAWELLAYGNAHPTYA